MHKVCSFLLKPGNPIALLLYHMRPKTHSGQFSLNLLHFLHSKIIIVVGRPERLSGQSKETGLVIYLAFLAKVASLYYIILTAYEKYWPDTVAKFISGTQETFI